MHRLLAAFPLLTGCATFGTFQNAETLGKGNWEVGIEPSMWGGSGESATLLYPHAGVSARVGLSDRVDIGGRVGSSGIELSGKFGLTERDANVPISIAPAVGGMAIGAADASVSILALHVPVLFGLRMGENQVVLGPKVHVWSFNAGAAGSSASAAIWSLGASAGYSAHVGGSVRLIPELALVRPLFGAGSADGVSDSVGVDGSGVFLQVGLGIVIGKPK
ncbi:MAG: hypothetical protein FJ090_00750 [Deltaproteobacteria bacterium]|nr:hypothetical protein [Deltaproteobacteria bacterium]